MFSTLSTVYSANGQSYTDAFALSKGSLKSTAEFIYGHPLPGAPELSKRGDYYISVGYSYNTSF